MLDWENSRHSVTLLVPSRYLYVFGVREDYIGLVFSHPKYTYWIATGYESATAAEFPREMNTEKRAQIFHTDNASLPRSG